MDGAKVAPRVASTEVEGRPLVADERNDGAESAVAADNVDRNERELATKQDKMLPQKQW